MGSPFPEKKRSEGGGRRTCLLGGAIPPVGEKEILEGELLGDESPGHSIGSQLKDERKRQQIG